MAKLLTLGTILGAVMMAHGAAAQDKAAVAAGEPLYKEHCSVCHGERLVPPDAAFDLRKLGPGGRDRYDAAMKEGRGPMPSFEGMLTPTQFDELWVYMRSVSQN